MKEMERKKGKREGGREKKEREKRKGVKLNEGKKFQWQGSNLQPSALNPISLLLSYRLRM